MKKETRPPYCLSRQKPELAARTPARSSPIGDLPRPPNPPAPRPGR
jgi:hypothetical protein